MLILTLLGVWLVIFGGIHPQVHKSKDVKEIIISVADFDESDNWPNETYRMTDTKSYERILSTQKEIDEFINVLGVTWDGIFPLNSHESGSPYYRVYIIRNKGNKKMLYFNNIEWGARGETPKRISEYMKKIMS